MKGRKILAILTSLGIIAALGAYLSLPDASAQAPKPGQKITWVFATNPGPAALPLAPIAADPDQQISTLPLLDAAERRQMLVAWNATTRAGPSCRRHRWSTTGRRAERRTTKRRTWR